MPHALAVTYARWHAPARTRENGDLSTLEESLYLNVRRDLEWLERELEWKGKGKGFLVGREVTAADTMWYVCFAYALCFPFGRFLFHLTPALCVFERKSGFLLFLSNVCLPRPGVCLHLRLVFVRDLTSPHTFQSPT